MRPAQRQTAPTRCTRASGNAQGEPCSEKNTHGKHELVGDAGTLIDGKRVQTSEFGGEHQVRPRPVDQIAECATIPSQDVAEVVGVCGKATDVTGKGVILGECAIHFKFWSQLELELAPSS